MRVPGIAKPPPLESRVHLFNKLTGVHDLSGYEQGGVPALVG